MLGPIDDYEDGEGRLRDFRQVRKFGGSFWD